MPQSKPNPALQPTPAAPTSKCSVEKAPNGGLIVHFLIGPQEAKRILSRVGPGDPATWLWDNLLRRGIDSLIY